MRGDDAPPIRMLAQVPSRKLNGGGFRLAMPGGHGNNEPRDLATLYPHQVVAEHFDVLRPLVGGVDVGRPAKDMRPSRSDSPGVVADQE